MKILKINNQIRRDFWADMVCEHCGHIEENISGYDDDNFHRNVIPDMVCEKCGKKADKDYRALSPKYAANKII